MEEIELCFCKDCMHEINNTFMAKNSVWLSVAMDSEELCLDCFQKRIGRNLTQEDFNLMLPANIENDRVRAICGFKPLTEEEKKQLEEFLLKKYMFS